MKDLRGNINQQVRRSRERDDQRDLVHNQPPVRVIDLWNSCLTINWAAEKKKKKRVHLQTVLAVQLDCAEYSKQQSASEQ